MLIRFFKIAWRHAVKNPSITLIQIVGLTIGMTVFLFIAMWINNQISFDRFNEKHKQIYRFEWSTDEFKGYTDQTLAFGPGVYNNISGVEDFVRFRMYGGGFINVINNGEIEKKVDFDYHVCTDSSFFRIFSFDFILGDPHTALEQPGSVVITKTLSQKLFGQENPIGKDLQIWGGENVVTGVIQDVNNFHIPFDLVRSLPDLKQSYANWGFEWDSWTTGYFHPTYFLLNKNSDPRTVTEQIREYFIDMYESIDPNIDIPTSLTMKLRPLKDIFFHGNTEREKGHIIHGNITLISGLTLIAILILFLAILNFINLNTSRTFMRSKEIGIRKIAGASRKNIFDQFTGEVLIQCLICLGLSIAFVQLLLPSFNNLISTNLHFEELFNKHNLVSSTGCVFMIVLIAGALPSISLASSKPSRVLKSFERGSSSQGFILRKFLLILQYSITIIVITATFLVQKQTKFMKNSDTGFEEANLVFSYGLGQSDLSGKLLLRDKLLEHPNILKATLTSSIPPGLQPSSADYSYKNKSILTQNASICPGFFETIGVDITTGRDFSFDNTSDDAYLKKPNDTEKIIINETAAKDFGMEHPVGSLLRRNSNEILEVIGVVKDFHFTPMKKEIQPIIFLYNSRLSTSAILVKLNSENRQDVLRHIKTQFSELRGNNDIAIRNLEDNYYKDYKIEEQLGKLFIWFALISILIGALGLYGISTNAIQRRIKEIGIRKAHGASAGSIMGMLQLYFTKIVLISGLIAIPISYYLLTRWLNGYPYKTDLSWWIFFGSLVFAVVIAIATISWKTWRAARSNPVNALRYE